MLLTTTHPSMGDPGLEPEASAGTFQGEVRDEPGGVSCSIAQGDLAWTVTFLIFPVNANGGS